ncbi:MAG: (Fe-S)-binding protein [Bacteroidetes bacterium]|nr:(Fe-S)-binding protein [Bacteroidota bacterium]
MIVDLFIPCYLDQFQPETARNTLKLLERVGCGVNYNIDQTCCGQPAYEDGYRDQCKEVGEKLIREFQEERYVVCPGPGCVATVRNHYPSMFHNSSLHNEYKLVQKHFYELSDFLVNIMHVSDIGAAYEAKAVLLDSCACKTDLKVESAMQSLLSKVKNLTLIPFDSGIPCCGAGGGLDRKNEALTVKMGMELITAAQKAGADTLISNDPLCLMHLNGIILKNKLSLRTIHIADVLTSSWS